MPPPLGTLQTLALGERLLQIRKTKSPRAGRYGRRRFLGCGFACTRCRRQSALRIESAILSAAARSSHLRSEVGIWCFTASPPSQRPRGVLEVGERANKFALHVEGAKVGIELHHRPRLYGAVIDRMMIFDEAVLYSAVVSLAVVSS